MLVSVAAAVATQMRPCASIASAEIFFSDRRVDRRGETTRTAQPRTDRDRVRRRTGARERRDERARAGRDGDDERERERSAADGGQVSSVAVAACARAEHPLRTREILTWLLHGFRGLSAPAVLRERTHYGR